MRNLLWIVGLALTLPLLAQENQIEIGTFNIEWFPCKDDGKLLKSYGIDLRYPPQGESTDIEALFHLLDSLDIELLGVQEIVDGPLFAQKAQHYLGDHYRFIYSKSGGSQKVGFLYDSTRLTLKGESRTYLSVALGEDSRLRPAFSAFFQYKKNGFDFHALVTHLKAMPSGRDIREKQWKAIKTILTDIQKDNEKDIILLGDFNNVSPIREQEFLPLMDQLNYYWATGELETKGSNYWQPDYKVERVQSSLIDHIFISDDAKVEYVDNSLKVGGMCATGAEEFKGDAIPDYFHTISDHCPVFATFRADVDND
ncbi:MAG: hypothetical protein GF313_17465 [Caldithrix sp.]|nr:hypothetical protein [Caldithrix sp.]